MLLLVVLIGTMLVELFFSLFFSFSFFSKFMDQAGFLSEAPNS